MALQQTSDGLLVRSTQAGSESERLGVPLNSRLVAIAGVSIVDRSRDEVLALLSQAVRPVEAIFEAVEQVFELCISVRHSAESIDAFFAAVFVIVKPLNAVLVFAGYLGMVVLHLILSAKQLK